MDLSSLNVDVLLCLMKFVHPYDRFNLLLSGILRGFENVNKGIDLRERIEDCGAELGLRCGSTCELEIRSLMFKRPPDESLLKILERLAEGGYLQNNRRLDVRFGFSCICRFVEVICSMKNLESLDLEEYEISADVLAHVFQSCSKLTNLHTATYDYEKLMMAEYLKNQLRSGFQKLRRLDLACFIDNGSWPVIQEMLTRLKECVQLNITNYNNEDRNISSSLVIDGSLTLDTNLADGLQILELWHVPAVLAKWILSVCLNINYLQIRYHKSPQGLHNEIARLKKLKKLYVSADEASDLKEIVRSCRQVEVLRMEVIGLTMSDLAELEPAETMTDVTLSWYMGHYMTEVLPVLKRWRNLTRLTLMGRTTHEYDPTRVGRETSFPPLEVLSDFILGMKHLSYLHIVPFYGDEDQLKILRDKVNELIVPRRPNFKFDISDD